MFSKGQEFLNSFLFYDRTGSTDSLFYSKRSEHLEILNVSGEDFLLSSSTFSSINIFNVLSTIIFYFFLIFSVFILFSIFFDKKVFFYIKKFSVFSEKRMFSLQDSLFFIFFYFLSVSSLLFFSLKIVNSFSVGYFFLLSNLLFIFTLIIQVPLLFFFNAGLFTFCLLAGSLKSSNFLRNIFDDLFGVLAYVIKYLLQAARWGLIMGVMFLANESLYFSLSFFDIFSFDSINTFANYTSISVSSILLSMAMFIFEAFDAVFLLTIQSSLFCILIFLIFSFMFSSSVSNYLEVIKR